MAAVGIIGALMKFAWSDDEPAKKGGSERRSDAGSRGTRGTRSQQGESGCRNRREAGGRKTRIEEVKKRARERRGEATSLVGVSESTRYRWQFKEADSWRNFGSSDNVDLEKLYCDVKNVKVEKELKDTTIKHSRQRPVKMSANFHTMKMRLNSNHFFIRRCSTPSYIKERDNNFPTLWVWYWKDDSVWKKYDETDLCSGTKQEQIEASYLNGDLSYLFQIGGKDYMIHFEDDFMYQRSADPEVQTKWFVRRRPIFVSKSTMQTTKRIPKGQATIFERTNLEKDCKKYRDVSRRFHKTVPEHKASIMRVEKIKNDHLSRNYKSKLQYMKDRQKPTRERLLFHGTTPDVVDAICTHNFDHRVRGKNGTKYGQGSYFAVDASLRNNYSNPGEEKTRYMFLAKVLTGEFKRGKQSFLRPPLKDSNNPAGDMYDSCVDDENQPKIFVIFSEQQCFPLYLIKYHLK